MKNQKNILLLTLVTFFTLFLSACTTVKVVPRGSLGGSDDGVVGGGLVVDQGQILDRQQVQSPPQTTSPRPLGVLKKTTTTGLETQKGSVGVRIDGDAPKELLSEVSTDLKALLERDFSVKGSWPSKVEAEAAIEELFRSKGHPLRIATTTGERGAFALVRYVVVNNQPPPVPVNNPPTTTETLMYSEGEIPTGAKRNPAVRGPEQFQPQRGQQRPQGVGQPRPQTQPALP